VLSAVFLNWPLWLIACRETLWLIISFGREKVKEYKRKKYFRIRE
jgi:hypothetical protein